MCQSIVAAVQNFFLSGKLLKANASFLIAPIPRYQNPSTFNDFRPISLLKFSYKIITKILAPRLVPILPNLISWHQAAFTKERSIHDHIALAHELVQAQPKDVGGLLLHETRHFRSV